MNEELIPHISEELKKKWVNYSFVGKPFKLRDGKTYIRAKSLAFNAIHYYCFETDWFWHDRPRIDIKKVEEELSNPLT